MAVNYSIDIKTKKIIKAEECEWPEDAIPGEHIRVDFVEENGETPFMVT